MSKGNKGIQRLVLLLVILLALAWGFGLIGKPPAGGSNLDPSKVSLFAANETGRFVVNGTVAAPPEAPFVYVSALRRVTLDNKESYTTVVESRKVETAEGSFKTEFLGFDNEAWLKKVKEKFSLANNIQPDGVIEIALTGFELKTPVARDYLTKSVFLGYQPEGY